MEWQHKYFMCRHRSESKNTSLEELQMGGCLFGEQERLQNTADFHDEPSGTMTFSRMCIADSEQNETEFKKKTTIVPLS